MPKPDLKLTFSRLVLIGSLLALITPVTVAQQRTKPTASTIPDSVLIRIVKAEDERRWDNDLSSLITDANAAVRKRAALAAGRIGDERAVPALISLLQTERDDDVRAMAAFALGETESPTAGEALVAELAKNGPSGVKSRVVEALGKTTAALPATDEARLLASRNAILQVLEAEQAPDTQVILMALTAALRARPENAGKAIAKFLSHSDSRVRADAANALARLRAKDGNEQLRKLLTSDRDPIVRANAARVLGATTDKESFESLAKLAKEDEDSRVRVSAIRALVAIKDQEPRVSGALISMGCESKLQMQKKLLYHERGAECLELITALGRVFQGTNDKHVLASFEHWQSDLHAWPVEVQIAKVRVSPKTYLEDSHQMRLWTSDWRELSSLAQGLGEVAALPESTKDKKDLAAKAEAQLRKLLHSSDSTAKGKKPVQRRNAIPDVLRALAAFKPPDLGTLLREHLKDADVNIRSTAADLLGEQGPDETNSRALITALPIALSDKTSNDAVLSILDALAKQKTQMGNEAIKSSLDSTDHLVRRRAVALLKSNDAGDFSSRIGTVQTRNTIADYRRAVSRIGKTVTARVNTSRGPFTITLLPEDAPLNVDNFVQLAKRGYFNGIRFHRVVPNFVIQGGDPRGDGSGGPGYQIRCEINQVPYDRAAVGMALSGKDTGGSQWFVTHSPQPHLDGGYTVFGRVETGMKVVDEIMRGDVIRSIVVTER